MLKSILNYVSHFLRFIAFDDSASLATFNLEHSFAILVVVHVFKWLSKARPVTFFHLSDAHCGGLKEKRPLHRLTHLNIYPPVGMLFGVVQVVESC